MCSRGRSYVVYIGYNDMTTTHPHLANQWHPTKNGSLLPTMVSSGSHKEVWWLCDECGYGGHDDWKTGIADRTHGNTSCPNCGDGVSYPEKVLALVLTLLKIKFKKQHRFDGYSYKYDFYLVDYNVIIEVHGIQHYWYLDVKTMYKRMSAKGRNGIEEHKNDVNKQNLAESNGYVYDINYYVLDARYSNIDYIRNSIEKCLFFQQFDLDSIDWQEIDKQAQTSQKIDICKYWKEGKEVNKDLATTDLAKEFGVDTTTIGEYLRWGNKNGLCEYDGEEELQAHHKRCSKEVYLVKPNGEKWFDEPMSQRGLARQSGINHVSISKLSQSSEPLKRRSKRAKYDPKYIGSYVMSVEDYNLKYGSN